MEARTLPFYVERGDAPGKRRILPAALALFAQQGLDGTSIRDIAAAARTTNPALYRHFATKDALALHLFIVCYRELWQRLALALAGARGFEARLAAFVEAFVAYHDACPEAVLYISENIQRFWPRVPAEMASRSVSALARRMIAAGVREGAVRRGVDMPVRVLGVVGQLFQLGRMIRLGLMEGPARRWEADLQRQLRDMLR